MVLWVLLVVVGFAGLTGSMVKHFISSIFSSSRNHRKGKGKTQEKGEREQSICNGVTNRLGIKTKMVTF